MPAPLEDRAAQQVELDEVREALDGTRWVHQKSGKTYSILAIGLIEDDHSQVIVYTDGKDVWIRPMLQFYTRFWRVE